VLLLVHRNHSRCNWIQLRAAICEPRAVLALQLLMLFFLLLLAITIFDLTDLSSMVAIGDAAAQFG
jgi:hypothetical protein